MAGSRGRPGAPGRLATPSIPREPRADSPAGAATATRAVQPVQSVDRALRILEILARTGGAGVTEIATELDVHKSTAFRLLAVLETHDLVEQETDRGTYALGFGVVRLAGATVGSHGPRADRPARVRGARRARGRDRERRDPRRGTAVNVCQAHGTSAIGSVNWVGRSTPLHATSSGQVLLACAPRPHGRRCSRSSSSASPSTPSADPELLRRELDSVRAEGWALTREAYEIGLYGVAAPVRDASGEVCGALSVTGPEYRLAPERHVEVVGQVRTAAAELGRRLGFLG